MEVLVNGLVLHANICLFQALVVWCVNWPPPNRPNLEFDREDAENMYLVIDMWCVCIGVLGFVSTDWVKFVENYFEQLVLHGISMQLLFIGT